MLIPAAAVVALFAAQTAPPEPVPGPATVVSVLRAGKQPERRIEGMAEIETSRKATAETNFRLASVTKHFTAAAILALVGDGKLKLTTRLGDVYPDWPEPAASVTIRQMLSHQSGLADYEDLLPPGDKQVSDDDVVAILKRKPALLFTAGTKFEYSNSAFVLLGAIVEKVTAKPFRAFVEKRLLKPPGMNRCVMHVEGKTKVKHRAFGYSPDGGVAGKWKRTDQSRTSATLGDGGLYCSLAGLEKWMSSSASMTTEMITPQKLADGAVTEYGFGWFVNHERIWHTGETMGFRNAILKDRRTGNIAIVLTNRADAKALALAESALGLKPAAAVPATR